jgi:predicted nucleic acid-binding protein
VFAQAAVTQDVAWQLYDSIVSDPRIDLAPEPAMLERTWRGLSALPLLAPNAWSDSYLAAFALAGGYEVVTFDQGFKRFPNLNCTVLT